VQERSALPPPSQAPQAPGFLRHEGRWLDWTLLGVGLVAALVVVGASLSSKGLISLPGTHQPTNPTAPQTTGQRAAVLPIAGVQAYDPFGNPRTENDNDAPNAVDGNPQTEWRTSHYKRSPNFGGLKPGVGIVLDVGTPKQARQLDLQLLYGGSNVEVYGSDSVPSSFDGWADHRLASVPDAQKDSTIDFSGNQSFQYYLIWFTRLPPAPDGNFQDGVAEATLRS